MWKRILAGIAFLLAVSAGGQMMLPSEASAQDVWVYTVHDSSYEQGYQVFVMTETIQSNGNNWVHVSTKNVRNGRLVERVDWRFNRMGDEWRYATGNMRGNDSRVYGGSAETVLNYCLAYINN